VYISYLPDEMSGVTFEESLKIGQELGLNWVEMRGVDGTNCIDLSDEQVRYAKRLLDQYGMKVSGLATPFLKCTMPGLDHEASGPMHAAREMSYDEHLGLIGRGVEIAKAFGTEKMRLFSFWYKEDVDFWETLDTAVKEALSRVEGTGITLAVENEGACMIRTTRDLVDALDRIDARAKFIYDPGNSARVGYSPKEGEFSAIAGRVALVHVKDGTWNAADGSSSPSLVGEGEVYWATELARVAADYDGALTLEPHYAPDGDSVRGMKETVAAVRRIAKEIGLTLE